ncbi:MAG: hypothetical protein HDR14_02600 [Lachnospiraceae bacterium]|nr:hypothetical protein [Lachnospiraceae bacterium]
MKKSGNAKNIKIETTMDLWNTFEKAANLQKNFYDKELEKQIRKNLALSDTVNIKKALKEEEISKEQLLLAILTAMQPFSQMICDLLKMFEKASAGQGDYNLRIQMKFKGMDNALNFSLENFRQYEKTTVQTCRTMKAKIPKNLWKLIDIYRQSWITANIDYINQNDIDQWLDEYYHNGKCPDFVPQRLSLGIPCLDKMTAICWNIFETAVAGCRRAYEETEGRYGTIRDECFQNKSNEQYCWCREFLFTMTATAWMFQRALTSEYKEEYAKKIVNDLTRYFEKAEVFNIDIPQTVVRLIEILNLPFWKRRHELYSAWVSTQIVEALQDRDIEFQVKDNTLSFSFEGSHIATCAGLCPPLEIWAELRTKAKKLIGSGRKKAIQPDYTLAVSPATEPDNSVAVIECKQHEKPSIKNFRDAVIDYANGRPQAVIMLTGYGNIPKKMHEKIKDEQIKSRSIDFSFMRPGSLATQKFKEKLRELVMEYYIKKSKENRYYLRPWSNPQEAVSVCFKWGEHPRDIELRLHMMEDSQEMAHIYYYAKGKEGEIPYAYLNKDVTLGWGPENVRISRWTEADYVIEVCDYSGESEKVSFDVEVCCGQDSFCFHRCDLSGAFKWNVFRMNRRGIETWHLTEET